MMGCRELDISNYYRLTSKPQNSYTRALPCTEKTPYTGFSYTVIPNYRFYSSEMGRWLSRDPMMEEGGWNLYGFINNNPISSIDLLGLARGPNTQECKDAKAKVKELKKELAKLILEYTKHAESLTEDMRKLKWAVKAANARVKAVKLAVEAQSKILGALGGVDLAMEVSHISAIDHDINNGRIPNTDGSTSGEIARAMAKKDELKKMLDKVTKQRDTAIYELALINEILIALTVILKNEVEKRQADIGHHQALANYWCCENIWSKSGDNYEYNR